MILNNGELEVYYNVPDKVDTKLDDALRELLKKFGYKQWASGYELGTGTRDLVFDKAGDE